MSLIRRASKTFAVALAFVATASAVAAQNADVCTRLQAQLITLERSGSGSTLETRAWDKAITDQQSEIQRASSQARRIGCVSGFVLFQQQSRDPRCANLMATIDRMRANLNRLTASRAQRVPNAFTVARQRNAILGSLQANRCGGTYASAEPENTGLFGRIFAQPVFPDNVSPDMTFGTYRTLCVRTCDGYYFPISFSTVPSQFGADANTCQKMCPGAEVALYTYSNPGGDVSQATSIAGDRYASLATAFLYRKEFVKSCTCGAVASSTPEFTQFDASGNISPDAATLADAPPPFPNLRPAFGEDPETVANRAGSLSPLKAVPAKDGPVTATADDDKVRIVGPSYYYGQ